MSSQLTADDGRRSLNNHAAAKGADVREKYGPAIGWKQLLQILEDPTCVRYPCKIVFDRAHLLPGELAHPLANGERPEDGFTIYVHPYFALQPGRVPYLVLYQLVLVNYGEFASPDDAEAFGAEALGLTKDVYYETLCQLADEID